MRTSLLLTNTLTYMVHGCKLRGEVWSIFVCIHKYSVLIHLHIRQCLLFILIKLIFIGYSATVSITIYPHTSCDMNTA